MLIIIYFKIKDFLNACFYKKLFMQFQYCIMMAEKNEKSALGAEEIKVKYANRSEQNK